MLKDFGKHQCATNHPIHCDDCVNALKKQISDLKVALEISTTTLETVFNKDPRNIAAKCCIDRNYGALELIIH